jgi:hypothetical protein
MRNYLILLAVVLAACNTAAPTTLTPTAVPTKTPTETATQTPIPRPSATPTLAPKAASEDEIISFALDFIVKEEILGLVEYVKTSNESWVPGPPKANIIIYAPVVHDANHPEWGPNVNPGQPIKVWWYENDRLVETEQKLEAIHRYTEQFMSTPSADIFAWGFYVFGIDSIAEDGSHAKLYMGATCGPVCGHGILYALRRQSSGAWLITDQQFLWGS